MQKEQNWKPVYLVTEAPDGWQRRSVEKSAKLLSQTEVQPYDATVRFWEETTGVSISETRFTVVVPIHNEEKSLSSAVGALFLSSVPDNVEMHSSFILNGCTDRSEEIIRNLLAIRGVVVEKQMADDEYSSYQDSGLDRKFLEVKQGNNLLRVYKTETKGKANALQIGANMACYDNHDVLISVDANNYLEPDTLALMYRESHKHFVSEKDRTVILSAIPKKVHKETLGRMEQLLREHGVWDNPTYAPVFGWCMALDAKWAAKNIQPVSVEDYALGVMARSQEKQVAVVNDARIWGYRTNFKDSLNQFRRSIRGRFQLLDLHPEVRKIVESDNYFMRPFADRIAVIAENIKSDPKRLPKYIWKLVYGELGLFLGKQDYRKEPYNQSWNSLSSTK